MPLGDVSPLYNHNDIREAQQSDPDLFYVSDAVVTPPSRVGPSTYTLRPIDTLTYTYLNDAGQGRALLHPLAPPCIPTCAICVRLGMVRNGRTNPTSMATTRRVTSCPTAYKLVIEAETYAPSARSSR